MALSIADALEYMLTYVSDDYDTDTGSAFYDLLYPVAVRVKEICESRVMSNADVFAQTATGEDLDLRVAEQGLTRLEGECAKGVLRFWGKEGAIVYAGAKAAAENVLYSADETATVSGGYVDVAATCTRVGTVGNAAAGAINRFPLTLPELTAVSNLEPFTGGVDAETDDELRERYFDKVSKPHTSGNKYDYEAWAQEASAAVGDVMVYPLGKDGNTPGTVTVVITDSDGNPATDELVETVRAHIEEERPIGAKVTVESAVELLVSVYIAAVTSDGSALTDAQKAAIEESIKEYLKTTARNKGYISVAQIGKCALEVDGVDDYTALTVNDSTENLVIQEGYVPVFGELKT